MPSVVAKGVALLVLFDHRGGLQRGNWRQKLSFTGMGTREFNHPDHPDEVSSAGGELEMQQPAQSPTLPGQPAHVMQVQQLPPPQTVAPQPSPVQQESVEPNEWL